MMKRLVGRLHRASMFTQRLVYRSSYQLEYRSMYRLVYWSM